MISKHSDSSPKGITIGLGSILVWLIGIILLLRGGTALWINFSYGLYSMLGGLLLITAAAFLLPPIRKLVHKITRISFSGGARFVIVLALMIAASYFSHPRYDFELEYFWEPGGYKFFFFSPQDTQGTDT